MKQIFFLLLFTATIYGQNPTPFTKLKITGNANSGTATKVNVQESNGEINTILKTALQDILFYATASALPVTGEKGKFYYTIDNDTYYTWNGTIYDELGAGGGATNLSYTASPTNGIVVSSSGTDATLPLADGTNAGLLSPADFTKLGNQSGTNTGDNATNTTSNSYADGKVSDTAYDATSWDGVTTIAPSKNTVRDKILSMDSNINNKQPLATYDVSNESIALLSTSGDIVYADVATYPNLTELSYVKGVTSSIQTQLNGKQGTLVSGTNIKTINSTSLLGSGDVAVEPTITAGTTAQYWRGDKTWQTLPAATTPAFTPLDEGGGTGYVVNGRTAANYGNIGQYATDISFSDAASSVRGATATYAFASGFATRASGQQSAAFNGATIASGQQSFASGSTSTASGQESTSMGGYTTASGQRSMAVNSTTTSSGYASFSAGDGTEAKSFSESVFGRLNTTYTPTSTTTWSSTDRLFGIGNGTTSPTTRSDALIMLKNGLTTLPSVTNTLIAAESTGKAIVTREYLELKAATGQIIVTSGTSFTTPSTITTATVFNIELVGGGAGGGGGVTGGSGSGGGAGGYCFKRITGLNPSTTYTCAIGAGGASASNGGATTLTIGGTTYTANGGSAGTSTASSAGGAGGTASNGDLNITGGAGDSVGTASNGGTGAKGGNTAKGWGNGGASTTVTTNGIDGTGYGGGGSAGRGNATNGGAGTAGIIFCQWYN